MNSKNRTWFAIAVAIAGFLVVVYAVMRRNKPFRGQNSQPLSAQQIGVSGSSLEKALLDGILHRKPGEKATKPFAPNLDGFKLLSRDQIILSKIRDVGRVKFPTPTEMKFAEIDVDPDVFTVYGVSPSKDSHLVFMAHRRVVDSKKAKDFAAEMIQSIPEMSGVTVTNTGSPDPLEGSLPKGVGKVELTSGKLSNGQEIHMALITRADNKGSYLFVAYGTPSHFEQQEGYYDFMLRNLQILPDKK